MANKEAGPMMPLPRNEAKAKRQDTIAVRWPIAGFGRLVEYARTTTGIKPQLRGWQHAKVFLYESAGGGVVEHENTRSVRGDVRRSLPVQGIEVMGGFD